MLLSALEAPAEHAADLKQQVLDTRVAIELLEAAREASAAGLTTRASTSSKMT